MSVTQRTAEVRTINREQAPDAGLLSQILDRVDAIAVQQSRPSPVHLRTWQEIEAFAVKAARSGMVPKDYVGKPDAICIAIQMGSELGLAPMQALQNIACINGRPAVWGDAMPALCRASGKCDYIKEWHEGEGDAQTFYCEAKRKDQAEPILGKFSVAEAKKAGLWGKNVWAAYPTRMMQMRARGFGLRDAFPDVLRGLITAEEAQDIPFDATGLTPRMPTTTEQAIGDTLPAHSSGEADPPRRTLRQFVDESIVALERATTKDEVDRLVYNEEMDRARERASNGNKDRLEAAVKAALDRTAAPPADPYADPDFPATREESAQ